MGSCKAYRPGPRARRHAFWGSGPWAAPPFAGEDRIRSRSSAELHGYRSGERLSTSAEPVVRRHGPPEILSRQTWADGSSHNPNHGQISLQDLLPKDFRDRPHGSGAVGQRSIWAGTRTDGRAYAGAEARNSLRTELRTCVARCFDVRRCECATAPMGGAGMRHAVSTCVRRHVKLCGRS